MAKRTSKKTVKKTVKKTATVKTTGGKAGGGGGRAGAGRVGGGARAAARAGLTDHCRSLVGTTEDVKWGEALVFSVVKKMYVIFDLDDQTRLAFQCDEEDFDRLTAMAGIIPAPYAAKLGWVKVLPEARIGIAELRRLLTKAHGLVARKLPKKTQRELGLL